QIFCALLQFKTVSRFDTRIANNQKPDGGKARGDTCGSVQEEFQPFCSNESSDNSNHGRCAINVEFGPNRRLGFWILPARNRNSIWNHLDVIPAKTLLDQPFADGMAVCDDAIGKTASQRLADDFEFVPVRKYTHVADRGDR